MFQKAILALAFGALAGAAIWFGEREGMLSDVFHEPMPDRALERTDSQPDLSSSHAGMLALPGMDCLVDETTGIRAKVLVTEEGVRCQDAVPGGGLVGNPLRHFFPYYVFDAWPRTGEPEYYRIGATPRRQSIKGWIPATSVVRWDTRVGVRYLRRDDGRVPPLRLFSSPDPLVEILQTGRTDERPIARATLEGSGPTLMPWPVSETKLVTVKGRVHELVKINFLAELPVRDTEEGSLVLDDAESTATSGAYTDAEVRRLLRDLTVLDIVFCVDNTRSTGPYLDSIRHAVRSIARRLDQLPTRPDLQVGLVLYRDYVDGIYFNDNGERSVTRSTGLTNDLEGFLHQVERLHEAPENSDEFAEAGYDGLLEAIEGTPWRGDQLASRVVVLIGDNSFHEPDSPKNPKGIGLARIQSAAELHRAQVFALNIHGGGGDDEQEIHLRQFRAIAEAGGGSCFDIDEATQVVDRIRTISDEQAERVHANVAVTQGIRAGKEVGVIAAEEQLDVRRVTEVMEFLEGADIDVERLVPGEPTFSQGWALVNFGGTDLLEREVYVAKAESEALVGALMSICSRYFVADDQGGADTFGRSLIGQSASHRVGDPLAEFFQADSAGPFDVFAVSKGIPVNPNSVLRMTRSEILYMSEADKAAIRDRINRWCIPNLVNAQNTDALWVFRDNYEFGWLPEVFLP